MKLRSKDYPHLVKHKGCWWGYIGLSTMHPIAPQRLRRREAVRRYRELLDGLQNAWNGFDRIAMGC